MNQMDFDSFLFVCHLLQSILFQHSTTCHRYLHHYHQVTSLSGGFVPATWAGLFGAELTLEVIFCLFDRNNLVRDVAPWLAYLFFLLCSFCLSSLVFLCQTLSDFSLDIGTTTKCIDVTTDLMWLFNTQRLMIFSSYGTTQLYHGGECALSTLHK